MATTPRPRVRVTQIQHPSTGLWARLTWGVYLDPLGRPLGEVVPGSIAARLDGRVVARLDAADVRAAEAEGRIRTVALSTDEDAEADTLAHLHGGIGRDAAQRLRRRLFERGLAYDRQPQAAERAGATGLAARHFRALTPEVARAVFNAA